MQENETNKCPDVNMWECTVTSEQYTIYKTNKPNEMWFLNPFKKQWTEILCSSKNSQVISKVAITIKKVLSYETEEILLYNHW